MEQFQDAKLIIIWGGNPIASNLHFWTRAQEAKRRGAKLIAIDPYRSLTAEKCHQHIALLPGTDSALALGMMHVLIRDDLLDHDYIAQLHARLRPAEGTRRRMDAGAHRRHLRHHAPTKWSTWRANTARPRGAASRSRSASTTACSACAAAAWRCATIACLPALVGAWRHPAGGVQLSSSGTFPTNKRRAAAPGPAERTPRRAPST